MIITRTPFRISFCGGGTDFENFYSQYEGCVLSTTINKYMHIMIHPSFNAKETIIKYSQTETVEDIKKIKHPIARQILLDYKLSGVETASIADIPSGTGLGSSSAYTVGLLHAVNAFLGKYKSQEWLANKACEIEIEKLGEPIGKQDQYAVAKGGLNFIKFLRNGEVEITPIIMKSSTYQELADNLLIFYIGHSRFASEILAQQKTNIIKGNINNNLIKMTELTYDLKYALEGNDLSAFGDILNQSWLLKRDLANGISNPLIDEYYNRAMNNGASGGKLLGAGGGGFLLFYCDKDKQMRLRAALSDLEEIPFKLDSNGSKVIYVGEKDWDN